MICNNWSFDICCGLARSPIWSAHGSYMKMKHDGSDRFRPGEKQMSDVFHGTTILALRHKGRVVVAGDGQVTLGHTITKHKARKVRRIYNDAIITGFAGATADALHLSEKLEQKLERFNGNLTRSAVELARELGASLVHGGSRINWRGEGDPLGMHFQPDYGFKFHEIPTYVYSVFFTWKAAARCVLTLALLLPIDVSI